MNGGVTRCCGAARRSFVLRVRRYATGQTVHAYVRTHARIAGSFLLRDLAVEVGKGGPATAAKFRGGSDPRLRLLFQRQPSQKHPARWRHMRPRWPKSRSEKGLRRRKRIPLGNGAPRYRGTRIPPTLDCCPLQDGGEGENMLEVESIQRNT